MHTKSYYRRYFFKRYISCIVFMLAIGVIGLPLMLQAIPTTLTAFTTIPFIYALTQTQLEKYISGDN